MLAPLARSQPLPRWARWPLSVPYRPGTPVYRLQDKMSTRVCTHTLPHVLQLQTLPPVGIGSYAVMCPTALDLTSLPRWASTLPYVLWLRISSPD
jgi:hypothetical protein